MADLERAVAEARKLSPSAELLSLVGPRWISLEKLGHSYHFEFLDLSGSKVSLTVLTDGVATYSTDRFLVQLRVGDLSVSPIGLAIAESLEPNIARICELLHERILHDTTKLG